jgi:hypothetical protein
MNAAIRIVLILLTAVNAGPLGRDSTFQVENNVVVLTDKNIAEALLKFTPTRLLVTYYANACPVSRAWIIELEKAAQILKDQGNNITLAKVEVMTNPVWQYMKSNKVPTIILYRTGKYNETVYTGLRNAKSLVYQLKFYP